MESFIIGELRGNVRSDRECTYWDIDGIVKYFCPETPSIESIGKLLVHTNVIPRYCHYSPGMAFSWQDREETPKTAVCHAIKTIDVPKLVTHLPGKRAAEFLSRIDEFHLQDAQKAKLSQGRPSSWPRSVKFLSQLWRIIGVIPRILAGARHSIG